jgi:hypothetical protein
MIPPVPSAKENLTKKMSMTVQMLTGIPDGRYAVSLSGGDDLTFIRVSRPKKGRLAGAIKVQTQHSDVLKDALNYLPNGRTEVHQAVMVDIILAVALNQRQAALTYGRRLNQCCKCGKTLTDERSRHYGIGPECEKHWPQIIVEVDEMELV